MSEEVTKRDELKNIVECVIEVDCWFVVVGAEPKPVTVKLFARAVELLPKQWVDASRQKVDLAA